MKTYLIALATGGEMGNPKIEYHNFEAIEANSESEAVEIYNKKHECAYYYGRCIGEIIGNKVLVDINYFGV